VSQQAYIMPPSLAERFNQLHQYLFETIVQPVLFQVGWMNLDEVAYEGTHLLLIGAIEMIALYAVLKSLEKWCPVEIWPDRKATRVDVLYTFLGRFGVLPVLFFFLLTPIVDAGNAALRLRGFIPPNLEDILGSAAALLAYLIVLDFADYCRHRLQHKFGVWWALHALHHSQRQMTFWTDDREHLLDLVIAAVWRAAIGLAIGVPPASFVTLSIFSAAMESLAHANTRLSFGGIFERIFVSPRYHRMHHAMSAGQRGCNFATLFPVWDIAFGTANFSDEYLPTGIDDQLTGRDYGDGFFRQQWLALKRIGENAGQS